MNNIKIEINLIKNKGNLLANANVYITTDELGIFILKDFQVWKSSFINSRLNDSINIRPPSVEIKETPGKYRPRIFFKDKKVWEELECQIWHSYQVKCLKEEPPLEDIKIPEEMPF